MTVRWETVKVGSHEMRVYMGVPERPGTYPCVVIAQHAGGVDAQMQDTVHRLHREGYIVAAPELFHRQPPAGLEPLQRIALLKDSEILQDVEATIAHMKSGRSTGAVGIAGFCMGGRVSYLAATTVRGLKAAAVFYGGNTMKALGEGPSPFERSPGIECPIIGLFGAEDTNPSPDDVAKISAELTRLGKWHEFHTYRDAGHAFENFIAPERYRERAARAAWGELLAFFDERLKRPLA
ncbi:MAG TPA: dienelactone hydrolase family protein [Burkholderiales bacterium]|jgi:carboxymethylenebutenolidase|nr:dienelactone hydrolase family protein [Burkholderiales bacterium]